MRTLALVLLFAATATSVSAQQEQRFNWHGRIAAGQTLRIVGINGYIHAVPATGAELQVNALKHGRRGNPQDVKIEVVPSDAGVTVCAVYPGGSGCGASGYTGESHTRNNDVAVDFDLQVPAGVRLVARTVNGGVSADNLTGEVDARTVNGGVHVATSGLASAQTVNGPIEVAIGRADWTGTLRFTTVNGPITVTLPANASAVVTAETVNGSLGTDFPLTVQGRFTRHRIQGTIGQGGRELELKTVNGSIDLRRH